MHNRAVMICRTLTPRAYKRLLFHTIAIPLVCGVAFGYQLAVHDHDAWSAIVFTITALVAVAASHWIGYARRPVLPVNGMRIAVALAALSLAACPPGDGKGGDDDDEADAGDKIDQGSVSAEKSDASIDSR